MKTKLTDGLVMYRGDLKEVMPEIREAKLGPLGIADIMRVRLLALRETIEGIDAVLYAPISSVDVVAQHMSGTIKIQNDSDLVKTLDAEADWHPINGTVLSGREYKRLDGIVVKNVDVRKYGRGLFRKPHVSGEENIICDALVHDVELIRGYEAETKGRIGVFVDCVDKDIMYATAWTMTGMHIASKTGATIFGGIGQQSGFTNVLAVTPEFKEKYLRGE